MQREPLAIRAKGRWRGILSALGVDDRFLTGRHGPCPVCSAGIDRWRFSDRDGTGSWICNQCGHGDGAELVKRLRQVDFKEAAKMIEEVIGEAKAEEPRKRLTDAQAKARMRAVWTHGGPLARDSFAGAYLASRGILDPYPTALRICQSPLMLLGKVISPDGKAVNVHRTFLTADGRKADRAKVRMLMEGITPAGSAIRLGSPDERLGVAEGLENALSAPLLAPDPCWATWSADSLAAFLAPAGVKHLTIWADNDANYHGQWAAMTCARANIARGLKVDVKVPDRVGSDWNDELMARSL